MSARLKAQVLEMSRVVTTMDFADTTHIRILVMLRSKILDNAVKYNLSIPLNVIEEALAGLTIEVVDEAMEDQAWIEELTGNMAEGIVRLYDALRARFSYPELMFVKMAKDFSITAKW